MNTLCIGTVLKSLRRERGITQERLAEYLNVTPQAVSRWECGLALPDITTVPVIAGFFGISCDRLLGTEADDRHSSRWLREKLSFEPTLDFSRQEIPDASLFMTWEELFGRIPGWIAAECARLSAFYGEE